jgi:predicted flap endonuclease-1-like 5' DNA nuclease
MELLWLVVGFVSGAAVVWLWVKRKVDEDTARLEASYEGRLRHLQEEVTRADEAHEETKELLRQLQSEKVAIEAEIREAAEEMVELRGELDQAKAGIAEIKARLEAAKVARAPAAPVTSTRAPAPAAPDERERRLKAIDAKLRMLPAGSSARAALLAERQRLAGDGAAASPAGEGDELEAIKGIGPKIHEELSRMGIASLSQLAALTPAQIAQIEERIGFPGRIERERWIAQAKDLLARRG